MRPPDCIQASTLETKFELRALSPGAVLHGAGQRAAGGAVPQAVGARCRRQQRPRKPPAAGGRQTQRRPRRGARQARPVNRSLGVSDALTPAHAPHCVEVAVHGHSHTGQRSESPHDGLGEGSHGMHDASWKHFHSSSGAGVAAPQPQALGGGVRVHERPRHVRRRGCDGPRDRWCVLFASLRCTRLVPTLELHVCHEMPPASRGILPTSSSGT